MTQAPSEKAYTTEQRLTALIAGETAAFYPVAGDTARTATAIIDDPYLTVPVISGSIYEVRCQVRYSGGSAGAAGHMAWLWSHPGGDFRMNTWYTGTGGSFTYQALIGTTSGVAAQTTGVANDMPWMGMGIYYCTASGFLTFQWGCLTNTGTNTHVKEGSCLTATIIGP